MSLSKQLEEDVAWQRECSQSAIRLREDRLRFAHFISCARTRAQVDHTSTLGAPIIQNHSAVSNARMTRSSVKALCAR
jgi:hypothetical protein